MLPAKIDERFHIAIKNGKKSEKEVIWKEIEVLKKCKFSSQTESPHFLEKLKNQKYLYKKQNPDINQNI